MGELQGARPHIDQVNFVEVDGHKSINLWSVARRLGLMKEKSEPVKRVALEALNRAVIGALNLVGAGPKQKGADRLQAATRAAIVVCAVGGAVTAGSGWVVCGIVATGANILVSSAQAAKKRTPGSAVQAGASPIAHACAIATAAGVKGLPLKVGCAALGIGATASSKVIDAHERGDPERGADSRSKRRHAVRPRKGD